MPEFIIRTGDMIKVTIPPPAVVPFLETPQPLTGSSENLTVTGTPTCLVGDELPVALRVPLAYTAPPFTNPGTGKLTLTLLPANQTMQTKNGKAILVRGQPFLALFTVDVPATQSTVAGPVPDPVVAKIGTAEFITANVTVSAA
ncbi:MAG: hypothetical protein JO345_06210 [Streptosporangiaceae bacterium]|nr:hypothetical protein [Streptosporangiaceae bacterium]